MHYYYIKQYFDITNELLFLHHDTIYYFSFISLSIFFCFCLFFRVVEKRCILCCTLGAIHILIALLYDYSYMHFNILEIAILSRNVALCKKIKCAVFIRFAINWIITGMFDLVTMTPHRHWEWEDVWWRFRVDYLRSLLNSYWYLINAQWYLARIQYHLLIPLVYFVHDWNLTAPGIDFIVL